MHSFIDLPFIPPFCPFFFAGAGKIIFGIFLLVEPTKHEHDRNKRDKQPYYGVSDDETYPPWRHGIRRGGTGSRLGEDVGVRKRKADMMKSLAYARARRRAVVIDEP